MLQLVISLKVSKSSSEMLKVTSVPCVSPHQSVVDYFTVDLTVLKEMSQALADLFGLTLPVSLKNEGIVEDKL